MKWDGRFVLEHDKNNEERIEELARICQSLGAPLGQSKLMASQLWKRSEQLAQSRGIKQVEALEHLLRLMVSRSHGGVDGNSAPEEG